MQVYLAKCCSPPIYYANTDERLFLAMMMQIQVDTIVIKKQLIIHSIVSLS